VNGGYALRIPVDAVSEFRILTLNAPAEYGQTSGATTTVVTKSGTNALHGDVYDFFRNNAFDARNFFAATTEPLHRNQYGATLGGPIRKDKDFFFLYYEGQRDSKGNPRRPSCPRRPSTQAIFPANRRSSMSSPAAVPEQHDSSVPAQPIALKAESSTRCPTLRPVRFTNPPRSDQQLRSGRLPFGSLFRQRQDQLFARYPRRAA
jgi:hypothetical protein